MSPHKDTVRYRLYHHGRLVGSYRTYAGIQAHLKAVYAITRFDEAIDRGFRVLGVAPQREIRA